jgi:hypothetical protein
MLTVTRFGRGVDPNGVERSSGRPHYEQHSILPTGFDRFGTLERLRRAA